MVKIGTSLKIQQEGEGKGGVLVGTAQTQWNITQPFKSYVYKQLITI